MRFLRDMLRHAYYWRSRDTEFPITRYVNAWGRPGDRALIALDDYHEVGAAWFRLYSESEPGFGFVDAETPELTIGAERGSAPGSTTRSSTARGTTASHGSASPSRRRTPPSTCTRAAGSGKWRATATS